MKSRVLGFVLAFLVASLLGCATKSAPPSIPSQSQLKSVAVQVLGVLKQAGIAATSVREIERAAFASGKVTAAQHAEFNANFAKLQAAADYAIAAVPVATSYAEMAAPVLAIVETINKARAFSGVSFDTVKALLASALAAIKPPSVALVFTMTEVTA